MPLPSETRRLSQELHRLWPSVPQGIYGDDAHQLRSSDHNKTTTSGKAGPRAIDMMTVDREVRSRIQAWVLNPGNRDEYRLTMFISNRRIWTRARRWRRRIYRGSNPHTGHCHISCDW